jgi:para-nitrobenzyl esterase
VKQACRSDLAPLPTACRSFALVLPALLAGAGAITATNRAIAALPEPARIESGLLSGAPARESSVSVYKGIPFAAAPTGERRWRAPQPPASWQGVRGATGFGSVCPQNVRNGPAAVDEDCLSLNVWTAAATERDKLPVFVWIHGGRFIFGSGSQPLFDGEGLARKGLVVVTLNYRLGVFGFLATPELSRESGHGASGNYALLDQIAALQWVRRNIAAFGGDPGRVTIAGQSAGSASVLMLVDSPLAKGLFHRAIAESGARFAHDPEISGLATSYRTLEGAEQAGVEYAAAHGAHSLAELRGLPADKLLDGNNANDESYYGKPPLFRPVVDGWVVPLNYSQTFAQGRQHDVPILSGNNLDESGAAPRPSVKLTDFVAAARMKYGALAADFLRLYVASNDEQAGEAANAAARESARVSTYLWSLDWKRHARSPAYTYFWTHAPPGPDRDRRGAYHESEINYVFDNLYATDRPWTEDDRRIAATMSSYWVNFARTGNPNGNGLPDWPAARVGLPAVMQLGDNFGAMPVADTARLDFWTRFFQTQKAW